MTTATENEQARVLAQPGPGREPKPLREVVQLPPAAGGATVFIQMVRSSAPASTAAPDPCGLALRIA